MVSAVTGPSFIYPDRPIYRAAETYNHFAPYAASAIIGLATPGNRETKFNAGADSVVNLLSQREIQKLYHKLLNWLYRKNPTLAEAMNNHPILVGGPLAAVGFMLSVFGGHGAEKLFAGFRKTPAVKGLIHRTLHSRPVNKALQFAKPVLKPLASFLGKPLVLGAMALGLLTFAGLLLFRTVQDRRAFGKAYREARQDIPRSEMNPYELRRAIALSRLREDGRLMPYHSQPHRDFQPAYAAPRNLYALA